MRYVAVLNYDNPTEQKRFFNSIDDEGVKGIDYKTGVTFVSESNVDINEIRKIGLVNNGLYPLTIGPSDSFSMDTNDDDADGIVSSMLLVLGYCANYQKKIPKGINKVKPLKERLEYLQYLSSDHKKWIEKFNKREAGRSNPFDVDETMFSFLEEVEAIAREMVSVSKDIRTMLEGFTPIDLA